MSKEPEASGYGLSRAGGNGRAAPPDLPYLPPRPRAYRPRIGLVGCGGISEYHLRAYQAMGLEVAALCDVDAARAERRRAEFYPEAAVFTDHRELLRRSDVEVVDLALHPAERLQAIEDVIRARRHVLSQKPFVLDLDTGAQLADLAEAMGVQLAVNQNGRWAPHFAWMTSAVRAELLGRVASVDFSLHWDHTWTAGTPFEKIQHLVLFDFGIHWFDLTARLLRGQTVRRVTASAASTAYQKMRPPMLAAVTMDFDDAQVRMAFNGHVIHGQEDRTVICGENGTMRSTGPNLSDQRVTLHTADGAADPRLQGTWFTSGFQGAMGELLCAIEDKRAPDHHARGNLDGLALCFAALASADTGRPVTPGEARRAPGL